MHEYVVRIGKERLGFTNRVVFFGRGLASLSGLILPPWNSMSDGNKCLMDDRHLFHLFNHCCRLSQEEKERPRFGIVQYHSSLVTYTLSYLIIFLLNYHHFFFYQFS